MQFEDIGEHCSFEMCHRRDFLPFQCSKCSKVYCLDHRTCKSHKCPKADADDVMLIICPICSAKIKITGADDPNVIFDNHSKTGCFPQLEVKQEKERCDADGCYTILTPINTYTCVKCGGLKYCLKHRFPDEHKCAPFKAAKKKSRLINPQLAQKGPTERCPLCLMFFPVSSLIEHCNKVHNVT